MDTFPQAKIHGLCGAAARVPFRRDNPLMIHRPQISCTKRPAVYRPRRRKITLYEDGLPCSIPGGRAAERFNGCVHHTRPITATAPDNTKTRTTTTTARPNLPIRPTQSQTHDLTATITTRTRKIAIRNFNNDRLIVLNGLADLVPLTICILAIVPPPPPQGSRTTTHPIIIVDDSVLFVSTFASMTPSPICSKSSPPVPAPAGFPSSVVSSISFHFSFLHLLRTYRKRAHICLKTRWPFQAVCMIAIHFNFDWNSMNI